MKSETWIFLSCTIFLVLVTPAYALVTGASDHGMDWTGTTALAMAARLPALVSLSPGSPARRMDARPEARKDGETAAGAGELGFFPPYSWWPLWCALTLGVIVYGAA